MTFDLDQCKPLKQKHKPALNQVRTDNGEGVLSFNLLSMSAVRFTFLPALYYVLSTTILDLQCGNRRTKVDPFWGHDPLWGREPVLGLTYTNK